MKVLAIGAHPDDLEILCGGTLARFVAEGHEVTMCNLALGDRGSYTHTREEISQLRLIEAQNSAHRIGAKHRTLRIADGDVRADSTDQRNHAIELIRQERPDVILIHHPADYNPDHVEAGKLMEDASFVATLPLYETTSGAHRLAPAIIYMDTLTGIGFQPQEYVDITEYIDVKLEALACHDSQVSWLAEHDNVDILDQARTSAAYRGYQAGVRYAEGFIPAQRWLRSRTHRLLP